MSDDAPAVKETLAEKLGTLPQPASAPAPAPVSPAGEPPKDKSGSLVLQFVVFPLLIVLIAVAITGFFQWLATDNRTYGDYLNEISSGWKQKRPEAAYQLQFRLADRDDPLRKSADVPRTIDVFEGAKKTRGEDPSVRRYVAIVLGHLGDERGVPALLDAVSTDEPDQETRLNATWALGRCRDSRAVPTLAGLLDDAFEGQRKTAAFALGEIGDKTASDALAKHLADPAVDVRWNCALSLARLGDQRAVPTLVAMLDRKLLSSIQAPRDGNHLDMTEKQREDVIVNALIGLKILGARSALEQVSAVADGDPSLRVRDAAMKVRDELKK
ncbi:MAG: HEAT repeat domain-containing protein [Planctomycetota bacterium]